MNEPATVQHQSNRKRKSEDIGPYYFDDNNTELWANVEEEAYQALVEYWISKKAKARLYSSEAPSESSSLPFPQKLWKVLESGQFQSVKWDDTATCVLINKDLIKNEIAEKKGILKIFGWSCLKSFQRQLQLYGFKQTRLDVQSEAAPVGKIRSFRQETLEDPSVGYVKDQDAELLATIEEAAFQAVVDYWISKKARARLSSSEAPSDCSSLPFPQKLWKVLESGQFQSVRWDETATCVLINKDLIKNEIAEKKGILKLFGWSCLKSFQRQLQLYGFRQTRLDGQSEAAPVGKVRDSMVQFSEMVNNLLMESLFPSAPKDKLLHLLAPPNELLLLHAFSLCLPNPLKETTLRRQQYTVKDGKKKLKYQNYHFFIFPLQALTASTVDPWPRQEWSARRVFPT
ncbi:HSFY1 protein, partial [Polypterus senegalus]